VGKVVASVLLGYVNHGSYNLFQAWAAPGEQQSRFVRPSVLDSRVSDMFHRAGLKRLFKEIRGNGGVLTRAVEQYLLGAPGSVDVYHSCGYVDVIPKGSPRPNFMVGNFLTPLSSGFEEKPLVWFVHPPTQDRFEFHDFGSYQSVVLHPEHSQRDAANALRAALPFLADIQANGGRLAAAVANGLETFPGDVSVNTGHGWGHIAVVPKGNPQPNGIVAKFLGEHSREFRNKPLVWFVDTLPEEKGAFAQVDCGSYFLTTLSPGHTEIDAAGAVACALMSLGRGELLPENVRRIFENADEDQ
jgi:hypothetical protein